MNGRTAAIDLGGTHVRAAVVSGDGEVLARARRRTPADEPRPDVLAAMVTEVAQARAGTEAGPVEQVVVGVPGVIDHDAEVLERAPNLPQSWIGWLTGAWLSDAIGAPVSLANDADLAALGEASFGAGQGYRDVVYVTISTGVGAGLVVNRKMVRSKHSGCEIGHTIIDVAAARAGLPCTVEELGAGPAIAAAAAKAGLVERDAELADLVRSGHPVATAIWNEAIEVVAFGIVNLAWLLAPQVVVIGGGVGNNHDLVLPVITKVLAERGPATYEPIAVVGAALGDDAALHGAARWFEAIGRPEAQAHREVERHG